MTIDLGWSWRLAPTPGGDHLDPHCMQVLARADAGEQEQLGRADHAGGEDDLPVGEGGLAPRPPMCSTPRQAVRSMRSRWVWALVTILRLGRPAAGAR